MTFPRCIRMVQNNSNWFSGCCIIRVVCRLLNLEETHTHTHSTSLTLRCTAEPKTVHNIRSEAWTMASSAGVTEMVLLQIGAVAAWYTGSSTDTALEQFWWDGLQWTEFALLPWCCLYTIWYMYLWKVMKTMRCVCVRNWWAAGIG